jgi:hypothetical protein
MASWAGRRFWNHSKQARHQRCGPEGLFFADRFGIFLSLFICTRECFGLDGTRPTDSPSEIGS